MGKDNPYQSPELYSERSGRRARSSNVAVILGLTALHLSATIWWSPTLALALLPHASPQSDLVVLTPGEAFISWLLTLPLGFVLGTSKLWAASVNSLAVAYILYRAAQLVRLWRR